MTIQDFVTLPPANLLKLALTAIKEVPHLSIIINTQVWYKAGRIPQMNISGLVLTHVLKLDSDPDFCQPNIWAYSNKLDHRLFDRLTFLRNVWEFLENFDYPGMSHVYTLNTDESTLFVEISRQRNKFVSATYHSDKKGFISNFELYLTIIEPLNLTFKV